MQKELNVRMRKTSVVVRPLADGGEGTVDALVQGMNGTFQEITVTGPLGEPVDCTYGISDRVSALLFIIDIYIRFDLI